VFPRTDAKLFCCGRKIRCLLLHDHLWLRQGLRRLLEDEPDFEAVGEAENAAECLRKVHELQPDVLIADATTFGVAAPEAERLVGEESSHTKIVFLNMEEQASQLGGWRDATADCAGRHTSAEDLVEMVRSSASTATNLGGRVLQDEPQLPMGAVFAPKRALTAREREVMKLLAEGKTVRAAAAVLGLSSKTVDAHKFNLMRKLGLHNKAELVMWAVQRKVVKIPANF